MAPILNYVLTNAIQVLVLALVVVAITRVYRHPQVAYLLWLLVLCKLVAPPIIRLPIAVLPTTPASVVENQVAAGQSERVAVIVDDSPRHVRQTIVYPTAEESAFSPWPVSWWIIGIWSLGTAIWSATFVWRVLVFRSLLRLAEPAGAELCKLAQLASRRLQLRTGCRLRVVDAPISPLLWSFGRFPTMLIPKQLVKDLSPEQLQTVLAHELAHLRRGDHLIRWLEVVIVGIFWWHPVAWLARREIQRAGEQCCDAIVVGMYPEFTVHYARALLDAAESIQETSQLCLTPPLASTLGHGPFLERRVSMILQHKLRASLAWHARLAIVVSTIVILPLSVRCVAQTLDKNPAKGKQSTKKSSRPAAGVKTKQKPATSRPAAVPRRAKVAPKQLGKIKVEVRYGRKAYRFTRFSSAVRKLQSILRKRREDLSDFRASISVNGSKFQYNDAFITLAACNRADQVLRLAKRSRISLASLGPIEMPRGDEAGSRSRDRSSGRGGQGGAAGRGGRGEIGRAHV